MNEALNRIAALEIELKNAPTWKVTTAWYTDREAEIASLSRKLGEQHKMMWADEPR